MKGLTQRRLIALHAITRGFAYCVFEGTGKLIDFGIKHVGRGDKNTKCLLILEQLLVRFDPHAIVFEDVTEALSKRSARVRSLYRQIEKLADRANLECYAYTWQIVFSVLGEGTPKTRHDLAKTIATILPDIAKRLPPKRRIWLPLDPRQALFDSAALGLTYYAVSDN